MRIDEDKIWTAYMGSKNLVTEKKGLPPWLKGKKGDKTEKNDKTEKGKKGKKGKKGLPPWLKGKGKKMVAEDMGEVPFIDDSMDDSDNDSLSAFLQELSAKDPDLYQRISDYMEETGNIGPDADVDFDDDDFGDDEFNDDLSNERIS
jgi:hypothetical protein